MPDESFTTGDMGKAGMIMAYPGADDGEVAVPRHWLQHARPDSAGGTVGLLVFKHVWALVVGDGHCVHTAAAGVPPDTASVDT